MQPLPIDPSRCPLCGESNHCTQAAGQPPDHPCWCRDVRFPPSLLARVPAEAKQRACICRQCAEQAQDPV